MFQDNFPDIMNCFIFQLISFFNEESSSVLKNL